MVVSTRFLLKLSRILALRRVDSKIFKGIGGIREKHTPCASRRSLKILRRIFFEIGFGLGRHLNEPTRRILVGESLFRRFIPLLGRTPPLLLLRVKKSEDDFFSLAGKFAYAGFFKCRPRPFQNSQHSRIIPYKNQ